MDPKTMTTPINSDKISAQASALDPRRDKKSAESKGPRPDVPLAVRSNADRAPDVARAQHAYVVSGRKAQGASLPDPQAAGALVERFREQLAAQPAVGVSAHRGLDAARTEALLVGPTS